MNYLCQIFMNVHTKREPKRRNYIYRTSKKWIQNFTSPAKINLYIISHWEIVFVFFVILIWGQILLSGGGSVTPELRLPSPESVPFSTDLFMYWNDWRTCWPLSYYLTDLRYTAQGSHYCALGLIRFHLFRSFILIANCYAADLRLNCPVCSLSIVSDPVPSHGTLRRLRSDRLGRIDRGRIPVFTEDAFLRPPWRISASSSGRIAAVGRTLVAFSVDDCVHSRQCCFGFLYVRLCFILRAVLRDHFSWLWQ